MNHAARLSATFDAQNTAMLLLLKSVRIVAPAQPELDGQVRDILIENGQIVKIGNDISHHNNVSVFEKPNAHVSIGWFDIGAQSADPGFEHRESLESLAAAAAAGGFTAVAPFPNTLPAIHSKSEIIYIKNQTAAQLVDFQPIGALSVDCLGKDLAEMLDMRAAGAVAFGDGLHATQNAGLLLRGLQYSKIFDGLIINFPNDATVAPQAQMHEGMVSTSLGILGFPPMAEELMIQRDLQLVEYADARLHLHNISTARAVALVRQAKQRGLRVTASVAALNLCFSDEALRDFDPNFKVMPPLREASDIAALVEGLKDGTIDFIASNHVPIDEEGKNLEFTYADFGAIGLETTFGLVNRFLHKTFTINDLVRFLGENPRRVLGLEIPTITEGSAANLTVFDPTDEWLFSEKNIRSKSKNTPLVGEILRGRVLGVVHRGQFSVVDF